MLRLISIALLLSFVSYKAMAGLSLQPIWQFQNDKPFYKAPIIHKEKVIFLSGDSEITAISAINGDVLWRQKHHDGIWDLSISIGGDLLYYGSKDKQVCALELATGDSVWCSKLAKNMQRAALKVEDRLYVVTAELGPGLSGDRTKGGWIYAIDNTSGEVLWKLGTNSYSMQSPIAKDGILYVAGSYYDPNIDVDEGGPVSITAINLKDAEQQWQFISEDGFVKSLYAYDHFLAFIGYQDFVSVLDTNSGKLVWKRDTGNWVPSISGFQDTLYYGSANTNVHAWNVVNGDDIWTYNIGGESFNYTLGSPIRIGDHVILLSQRGWLSILDANTGNLLMQDKLNISAHIGLNASQELIVIGDSSGTIHAYQMTH